MRLSTTSRFRIRGVFNWAHCDVVWASRRLAAFAVLTAAIAGYRCDPFYPQDVAFTFDNRTDTLLCYFPSARDAEAARCLQELKPRDETHWSPDCDGVDSRPITVIITVKDSGSQIYEGTASCGKWNDTKRRFVIEQEGEEFVVTDSLPDASPSP